MGSFAKVSLVALLLGVAVGISPPLKDVASDKKFFGPPFPADYPEDKRPVPQKSILDKVKSAGKAYPALQSKADFDSDFVKDENSDTGAWEAQFEYDALRKKLAQKEADKKRAEARSSKEDGETSKAQKDADAAGKKVSDAQKDVSDAAGGEDSANKDDSANGVDSESEATKENLKKLKQKVAEAEEKYEEQKKSFEECKAQLAAAKAKVEELKAQQAAMEKKLAEETQLWVEAKHQQTMRLDLKKSKKASAAKVVADLNKQETTAAADKVAKLSATKAVLDKALAKEKAEHEHAQKNLRKEKGELDQTKQDLEKAAAKLQKLHGYKPAKAAAPTPTQSSAGGPMSWVKSLWR